MSEEGVMVWLEQRGGGGGDTGEVINTPSEREPNNLGHVHLREGRPCRKGIYNRG